MYRWIRMICPSDFFTDFTVSLRCTVKHVHLTAQRIEGCLYGFYGVKAHTLIYRDIKKIIQMTRARARKSILTP